MKYCYKCKNSKPRTDFYKSKSRYDGLNGICKDCSTKKVHEWVLNNKEKNAERKRRQALRNRQFIYNYLKSHPCVDCGEQDPIVLEFDHINGKSWSISSGANRGNSIARIKEEIAKCEVRCANCHRRRTSIEQNWYSDLEDK